MYIVYHLLKEFRADKRLTFSILGAELSEGLQRVADGGGNIDNNNVTTSQASSIITSIYVHCIGRDIMI